MSGSPVRVLHVIGSVGARYGGPSQAVLKMCDHLNALSPRFRADIVTTDAGSPDGTRLARQMDQPASGRHSRQTPVRYFHYRGPECLKFSLAMGLWLERHIRAYDLVHIHGVFSWPATVAAYLCRRHGVPYVVRPLGMLDPWALRRHGLRKGLYRSVVEAANVRTATGIHFTTDMEQCLAEKTVGRPARRRGFVIPIGIEEAVFESPQLAGRFRQRHPRLADKRIVLFLGRLHPKKNIELVLEALRRLPAGIRSDLVLVIAGDGTRDYRSHLADRVIKAGVEKQVFWAGWLEGQDKLEALADADLFILTSKLENFGIAVAEAMAAGVPVIVSPGVYLHSDIVHHQAGLVVGPRSDEVARALERMAADAALRARLAANARTLARSRYAWPRIIQALVGRYAELLSAG